MNQSEQNLLTVLSEINKFEHLCQRIQAPEAVPPIVYQLLGQLRDQLAKWGMECVVMDGKKKGN